MRYRSRPQAPRYGAWLAGLLALATSSVLTAAVFTPGTAAAQPKQVQDTFTATTAGMTPAGLGLKVQIIRWSDEAARAAAIATLDDSAALARLPTAGYIWPTGSPVGYTVKYAHKTPAAGGGERITLVTDRMLGSYDFKKWSPMTSAPTSAAKYSVVELYLDGNGRGVGNLSLGAEVVIDATGGTVTLATGGTNLLANVERQPPT